MTRKRRTPARTAAPAGVVTGVARGNLGTATNLEDTQVFDVDELQAANVEAQRPAHVADIPADIPADEPDEFDEFDEFDEPAMPPVEAPRAVPIRRPAARAVQAASTWRPRRSTGPHFGWSVFAAGAIVAVIVGAILGAAATKPGSSSLAADQTFSIAAPPAPTETNGGGKGHGNGNGNGNGHGNGGG